MDSDPNMTRGESGNVMKEQRILHLRSNQNSPCTRNQPTRVHNRTASGVVEWKAAVSRTLKVLQTLGPSEACVREWNLDRFEGAFRSIQGR